MGNSKVIYGQETLIDLTGDSVTPSTLTRGTTAHNAAGEKIEGSMAVKMRVNLTYDGARNAWTADHTFAEMQEAIGNGDSVEVSTAYMKLPLVSHDNSFLIFSGTVCNDKCYSRTVIINSSNLITYIEKPLVYEENFNELDATVNQLFEEIANMGGGTSIPTFWQAAVDECIDKIKSLQVGRHCVTFPFFSDNHQRLGYAGVLIAKVMKECNIPYCMYGGDSIANGYIDSEATMNAQDKAFDEMMTAIPNGRLCRAVGNHDGYWQVSEGESYTYTREQIYELFLREEAISQLKHFGKDGTYYYVDDIASKTRFIVLNSNGEFGSAQIDWLSNTALQFGESGWTVAFVSHQPVVNAKHSYIYDAQTMQSLITNYINSEYENKAEIVGWFSGHVHMDRIYQCDHTGDYNKDDTTTVSLPWKTVTITSDHTSIAYDNSTKHAVAEDALSHAIDFVTINKKTKMVNITRLGIGNDRSFSYIDEPPSYTNLYIVEEAVDDARINSSGSAVYDAGSAGKFVTGYIQATKADVIRVKGTSKIYNVCTYGNNKSVIGSNSTSPYLTVATVGDVHTIDLTTVYNPNSTGYIRIQMAGEPTDNIIITKNEEIAVQIKTNQIPLSVNADDTPYNSGAGYKTDYRVNSAGNEVAQSGMCVTGFIPYNSETISLKNVTIAGTKDAYIARYTPDKVYIEVKALSAILIDDGTGVLTGSLSHAGYIRITCGVIDETSILTLN